jgi:hypothetical protein
MEDIKAVVNDYGVALHIGVATDKDVLAGYSGNWEVSAILPHLTSYQFPTRMGSGKNAKPFLQRCGIPFEEAENALAYN